MRNIALIDASQPPTTQARLAQGADTVIVVEEEKMQRISQLKRFIRIVSETNRLPVNKPEDLDDMIDFFSHLKQQLMAHSDEKCVIKTEEKSNNKDDVLSLICNIR